MRRPRLSPWRPRSPRICFIRTKSWKRRVRSWPTAIRSSKRFRASLPTPESAAPWGATNRLVSRTRGWPERTAAYLEGAERSSSRRRKALATPTLTAADVDTVVTVSSTGIATPSLEARVAADGLSLRRRAGAGLRPWLRRRRLGPLHRLAPRAGAARHHRAAGRGRALHACLRLDELTKANIVATGFFGDGAAACILRAGDGGALIEMTGEHTWPDTLDIMGWGVDPEALA